MIRRMILGAFILAASCLMVLTTTGTASASSPVTEVVRMTVASETVPCQGVGPQSCMKVKIGDGPWQVMYDRIEGFTYEPGSQYVLEVTVEHLPEPAQDASSIRYHLFRVISRTVA